MRLYLLLALVSGLVLAILHPALTSEPPKDLALSDSFHLERGSEIREYPQPRMQSYRRARGHALARYNSNPNVNHNAYYSSNNGPSFGNAKSSQALKCALHQFLCVKDDRCIHTKNRCDGRNDCSDGADELSCPTTTETTTTSPPVPTQSEALKDSHFTKRDGYLYQTPNKLNCQCTCDPV